jgi:DNA-binding CsgD family transcriptional regulator
MSARPVAVSVRGRSAPTRASLSAAERECLELAATGLPLKHVALHRGVSEQTVKNHLSTAYGKLGVSSLVEAMNELGWVRVA